MYRGIEQESSNLLEDDTAPDSQQESFESFTESEAPDAYIYPELDDQPRSPDHYALDLLSPDMRATYETFARYVDFSTINQLRSNNEVGQADLTSEQMQQLLSKSRDLRNLMKSPTTCELVARQSTSTQ